MALGKQAKIITPKQERAVLHHLAGTRWAKRDRAMFIASIKAGLRAKEIAGLKWRMVTDSDGNVGDVIALENSASKGKGGGRVVPMHPQLREALIELAAEAFSTEGDAPVFTSERGGHMTAKGIGQHFQRVYEALGMTGCSSHSGRRTFITNAAKKVSEVGGSLRDVQELAGHASLQTTQRYIQGDSDAKRKLIGLI